jgi:hypothetical protein
MSSKLLAATQSDDLSTIVDALAQWLVAEHGASIKEDAWSIMCIFRKQKSGIFWFPASMTQPLMMRLRTSSCECWLMKNILPVTHTQTLLTEHAKVVQEWVRLQARLPAYLAQRRTIFDAHCPLMAPL